MTVEEYVYWGGVVQGEGLTEYIRNFRRRMFSTASAIFWMYNDCWPAVRRWTIVDYYGRRTPGFYPVRRAWQPVTVAIAAGRQSTCSRRKRGAGWPVNALRPLCARGRLSVDERRDGQPARERLHAHRRVRRRRSGRGWANDARCVRDPEPTAAKSPRDRLFMPSFKEMVWPAAEVRVRHENGQAIFESDVFAWRVCLDLDGEARPARQLLRRAARHPDGAGLAGALGEPRILRLGNQG